MPPAQYPHLFLPGPSRTQGFTSPQKGGSQPRFPSRDRPAHAERLRHQLEVAFFESNAAQVAVKSDRNGTYLMFVSEPTFDLALRSLDVMGSGIRLLNVRVREEGGALFTLATVFVPKAAGQHFLQKVQQYAAEDTAGPNSKPKNAALITPISAIRRALFQESFWNDAPDLMPGADPDWVEAWLSTDEPSRVARFRALCGQLQIELRDGQLTFPERTVVLVCASRPQLELLVERSDDLAEFRAAREVATFFRELRNRDQADFVTDLLARSTFNGLDQTVVLILDHGVNNGHPLLRPVLPDADKHTVKPEWGTHDHEGHGTLMAGTAAYGDLLAHLQDNRALEIEHGLESAKILPPPPNQTAKHLWGCYTAQGVSLAEIQAPAKKRVICMAVTSENSGQRGRPSSWSGAIDELAAGVLDSRQRLFILSAGNVELFDLHNYPQASLTKEVMDPAQAWNALTVGAFTNKTRISDPTLAGYRPLAEVGGLSPFSSTSATWADGKWPIKPEVLFEGGNALLAPGGDADTHPDLELVSTHRFPLISHFESFNATSAAAAQAACMAAKIQSKYREAWPETVRALIVHTAEWTEAQKRTFLTKDNKTGYIRLARICGYGVPNLERALSCAANSLTLIAQAALQPFDEHVDGSRGITRDMHLYRLPWPKEVLLGLGEMDVRMRVTLSYFIEPSPGEIGWRDRYRYASHALRFQLNAPGEGEADFIRRINDKAREDDESAATDGPNEHWTLGKARDVGSIHSDIWTGTAAELADSNLVAVHPAVGWWRERRHLNCRKKTARYALVVSVRLPVQEIDIYTPVATQLGIRIPTPIAVQVAG